MKTILKKDKKILFKIFKNEILSKYSVSLLCSNLNLHRGTINRWCSNKEVPLNYFNQINKLLNYKYSLNISKEEYYKSFDQFFTPSSVSKKLINETIGFIEGNWDIDLSTYDLIEPSAGDGSFYFNFPKNKFKRIIALDIEPKNKQITKLDWLEYKPSNKKNIVIGNPPFGLRGQLALQFINHAAKYCDFICFVLPPLFNSNGKGSPMLRIDKNFYLAKEIKIEDNNFVYPNGKKVKINSIFQIWSNKFSKTVLPILPPKKISEWIKVYSLSNGSSSNSKRNIQMIGKCDFYLPSTSFRKIVLETEFKNLPNNRGYGIVILKNKTKIRNIIKNINWDEISFKSTNSANNLRSQLIIQAIESAI